MSGAARVADALVLAFSEGVSLRTWAEAGLLEREWALYERVRERVGRIVLVTYGGEDDRELLDRLPAGVGLVCNEFMERAGAYLDSIPARVVREVGEADRVVVKANQMSGGEASLGIAAALRESGRRTALIARAGYLWSQFVAIEQGAESERAAGAAAREGRLCRGADLVVGTTRQMVQDLAWRHGLAERVLEVVPNYVIDERDGAPPARDSETILFVGRLERQKRIDRLMEAVSLLPEPLRGRVRLSIVGAGSLLKQLGAFAEELGIEVSFEGRLPHGEARERMRSCAVYAQTSAYEGHPKAVLEAMASGAPVLVVDEPGLRGLVRQGATGVCMPPEPRAIAAALEALLRDPAWRRAMGAGAAEQARAEWSLDRVARLEAGAYERALLAASARAREPLGAGVAADA